MTKSALKKRLRRLVIDAKEGLQQENAELLKSYISEFNSILHELKNHQIGIGIQPFSFDPGMDEAYLGGISYSGKAKIQGIITTSQNILNEHVGEDKKWINIRWKGFFGVVFSGLMIFLFNFFYTLGIKHTEKKYDNEKFELQNKNEQLMRALDSCTKLKTKNDSLNSSNNSKKINRK